MKMKLRESLLPQKNKMVLDSKRKAAFEKLKATIKNKEWNLHVGLAAHSSGDDIKAAFLYCGGKPNSLKDGKRATFEQAIIEQFSCRFNDEECDDVLKLDVNSGINIPKCNEIDTNEMGTIEEI